MNKVRNCHSPAGMSFSLQGTHYVHLKDCPGCKYGTLDLKGDGKGGKKLKCADCGREYPAVQKDTSV